jgi:hypothetical protein
MNDIEARAQAIIDAARDEHDPTAEDRARVRSALSAALVPAAGAGAGSALPDAALHASEAQATAMTLTTKLLIGGSLVGATGLGTGYLAVQHAAAPSRPPSAIHAPAPATAPAGRPASAPAEADAPQSEAGQTEPSAPLQRRRPSSAPTIGGATASRSDSSLAQELALLRQAQRALQSNDGRRSLGLLDEMAKKHPDGVLGEEAAAARVFALCQAGRSKEARVQAARFAREYPGSVLAPRVQSSCVSSSRASAGTAQPESTRKQTESLGTGQSGGWHEPDEPPRR